MPVRVMTETQTPACTSVREQMWKNCNLPLVLSSHLLQRRRVVECNRKTKHIRHLVVGLVGVPHINTLVFPDAKITQNNRISNLWAM